MYVHEKGCGRFRCQQSALSQNIYNEFADLWQQVTHYQNTHRDLMVSTWNCRHPRNHSIRCCRLNESIATNTCRSTWLWMEIDCHSICRENRRNRICRLSPAKCFWSTIRRWCGLRNKVSKPVFPTKLPNVYSNLWLWLTSKKSYSQFGDNSMLKLLRKSNWMTWSSGALLCAWKQKKRTQNLERQSQRNFVCYAWDVNRKHFDFRHYYFSLIKGLVAAARARHLLYK